MTIAILPTRMNFDLAIGDEWLKKTGAGDLFMDFGEPDVRIHCPRNTRKDTKPETGPSRDLASLAGDQFAVEIKGVDLSNPTTGPIRNRSTDDIACWFNDTDYNGESCCVRHAYFTGADEPCEKVKCPLRATIDEAAWSSLHAATSRPFDKPKTGKIAVKVINHYGDEALKLCELSR